MIINRRGIFLIILLLKRQLKELLPKKSDWTLSKSYWEHVWPMIENILNDSALNDETKINKLELYLILLIQKNRVLKEKKKKAQGKKTTSVLEKMDDQLKACLSLRREEGADNILLIMLSIVCSHNGYYAREHFKDDLSVLVQNLIQMPFETLSKQIESPEWITQVSKSFIHEVNCLIFSCVNPVFSCTRSLISDASSNADKLWLLTCEIRKLHEKSRDNEAAYLMACLKMITAVEFRVLSSSIEHSVWASAAMESWEMYLVPLIGSLRKYIEMTVTSDQKQRPATATNTIQATIGSIRDHFVRATFYSNCAISYGEPIGHFVQAMLLGVANELRRFKAQLEQFKGHAEAFISSALTEVLSQLNLGEALEKIDHDTVLARIFNLMRVSKAKREERYNQNITLFNEAYHAIVKVPEDQIPFEKVMGLAAKLKVNQCPLGEYLEVMIFCLRTPLSEQMLTQTMGNLKCIVVDKSWCENVGELWLYLANHFYMRWNNQHLHYKKAAVECLTELTSKYSSLDRLWPKYGTTVFQKAETLLKIVRPLEKPLETPGQVFSLDHENVCPLLESDNTYIKQHQADLVSFLFQSGKDETTVELLASHCQRLIAQNYPYAFPILIKYLLMNKSCIEYQAASSALLAVYGDLFVVKGGQEVCPLKICEALRQVQDNRRLLIWASLLRNALKNGLMKDEIQSWKENEFDEIDIKYKLLNIVRSEINSTIKIEGKILPGGREYLIELDRELYEITLDLIKKIEVLLKRASSGDAQTAVKFWRFTKYRPGLLLASFAEMAGRCRNYKLMRDLCNLAIHQSGEHIILLPTDNFPRQSSPKAKPLSHSVPDMKAGSPREKSGSPLSPSLSPRFSSEINPISPRSRSVTIGSSSRIMQSTRASEVIRVGSSPARSGSVSEVSPRSSSSPSSLQYSHKPIRTSLPRDMVLTAGGSSTRLSEEMSSRSFNEASPDSLVSQEPVQLQVPSYLPYFLLALEIWFERLENNPEKQDKDVREFKEYLRQSLPENEYQDPRERDGIRALILYYYQSQKQKDTIWLTDEDQSLYGRKSTKYAIFLQKERAARVSGGAEAKYDCFLCYEIRVLLESAMQEPMFPLAARLYADEIAMQELTYLDQDEAQVKAFVNNIIKYCFKAVVEYGYIPPLFPLAVKIAKYIDDFTDEDNSRLSILKKIQSYLIKSERYEFILPGQKRDFEESIRREEEKVAQEEEFQKLNFQHTRPKIEFSENPFQDFPIYFHSQGKKLEIDFLKLDKENEFVLRIKHFEPSWETINLAGSPDKGEGRLSGYMNALVLKKLHECFVRAERLYTYTNKVYFDTPATVLDLQNNCLTIKHFDVALLGLVKLVRVLCENNNSVSVNIELNILANFVIKLPANFGDKLLWEGTRRKIEEFAVEYERVREDASRNLKKGSRSMSRLGSRRGSVAIPRADGQSKSPPRPPRLLERLVEPDSIPSPMASPMHTPPGSPIILRKENPSDDGSILDLSQSDQLSNGVTK